MVTLLESKGAEAVVGCEVTFLMDAGAKCNLLPLNVYKEVISVLEIVFLNSEDITMSFQILLLI